MTTGAQTRGFRFPMFQGILPIDSSRLPRDIIAGLTLAALAIPETMGYTKIAGVPVILGLYTILIPITLFAIFGSSRHLVVGADSATAAILSAGLTGLAVRGSDEWVALCAVLAFIAAAFMFVARLIRLGFLADFLSRTVLVGFLTGVGVQVAIGQVSGMLDLPGGGNGPLEKLSHDLQHLGETNPYAAAVSFAVLAIILGSKKVSENIPGGLLAVVGAIVVSWAINLGSHMHTLGEVPSGLPTIGLPHVTWSWDLLQKLLPTAFACFIVILAQSAATSRAYAAKYSEIADENIDMVGLGIANVGAGLSGTFMVNGSPTKTQMVDSAGGHSQISNITTAVVVLMVLLFLTRPLAFMPTAVLSAVVFLIGLEMIDIRGMHKIFAEARSEFWVSLLTALTVVLVGVEQGIILAIVLSLLDHVRHGYRGHNAVIAADTVEGWETVPVSSPAQIQPGLLVYLFSHSAYYANAQQLADEVMKLATEAQPGLSWLCIDMVAMGDIDFSAAATLRETTALLQMQGIRLVLVHTSSDVRAQLDRYGITATLGTDAYFGSIRAVMEAHAKENSVTAGKA
jgi:sulfate permease, SulP family